MALEIEHKYLVTDDCYKEMAERTCEIKQGYLNRDPERTVRVRIKDEEGFLTVKGKTQACEGEKADTRCEFEYRIPKADALSLLGLCTAPIIEKTRHMVKWEGKLWEVDEFHGSREGLTVAEIELSEAKESYSLPPFVGKEVTADPQYYNSNL